jgi:hypothetical protein
MQVKPRDKGREGSIRIAAVMLWCIRLTLQHVAKSAKSLKRPNVVSHTVSSREKGYCSAGVMENTALTTIETVALVVEKPGSGFKLTPVVFDEVRDDEYLIEMMYSGICHTVHLIPC